LEQGLWSYGDDTTVANSQDEKTEYRIVGIKACLQGTITNEDESIIITPMQVLIRARERC
jgi:hypothetical protein